MSKLHARRRPQAKGRKRVTGEPGQAHPEASEVRELVGAIEKTEKTMALYPGGSPVLNSLVSEVHRRLLGLLERVHVVELLITADEIDYEGEQVYDGTRSERSFSFLLEDGGVRRLVFLEGIDETEVRAFFHAFEDARKPDAEELLTLLWQRDLKHVSYVSVHVFKDPKAEEAIAALDVAGAAKQLVDRLRKRSFSIDQVASVRNTSGDGDGGAEEEAAPGGEPEKPEVFTLAEEETEGLRTLVKEQAEESQTVATADVLLALLSPDDPEDALAAQLASIRATALDLLEDGDVATAARIVCTIARHAEEREGAAAKDAKDAKDAKPGAPGALRAFLTGIATRDTGARLARALSRAKGDKDALAGVRAFVISAGKAAFELAPDLVSTPGCDRGLLDAFVEVLRDDVRELRFKATDGNAKAASAAIRLLLELAGEGAIDEYGRAMVHKDPAVRRDAIQALARCRNPHVIDRLVEVLDDPAPDVRAAAYRALPPGPAVPPRPDLYQKVVKRVEDRHFEDRPPQEQAALLALLAKLDLEKGLALLEARLRARAFFFRRAATQRRRLCAIAALGDVVAPEAEALLKQTEGAFRSEEVRAACRAALHRQATRKAEPPPPPLKGERLETRRYRKPGAAP